MNTKLTLSLDSFIIQKVKKYAKQHHVSLSRMVQNYFQSLVRERSNKFKLTPIVKELSGILTGKGDFNWKEEYARYLTRKYSR